MRKCDKKFLKNSQNSKKENKQFLSLVIFLKLIVLK